MGRDNTRKTGLWLPALIGLLIVAAGIRYVSSRGWWPNLGADREQSYQTISSGASIQVGGSSTLLLPRTTPNPTPNPSDPPANPPKRLW